MMRSFISLAALLVNVTAKILSGATPSSSIKYAILVVSVLVLPVPAPATTKRGPLTWVAAFFCCGFNCSNQLVIFILFITFLKRYNFIKFVFIIVIVVTVEISISNELEFFFM